MTGMFLRGIDESPRRRMVSAGLFVAAVLDLRGARQVFVVATGDHMSATDAADLRAALSSIRIER